MNRKLEKIFNELEAEKHKLLNQLMKIDSARLNYSPSPGKWSVNQILIHIITAEALSLGYMKKKSLGIETFGDSGVLEFLKMKLLIVSQRFPFKFKAPRFILQHTPTSSSFSDIVTQWNKHRDELKKFLESINDKNVHKKTYKHPKVGMLNIIQAITFFREHHIHHLPQIRKLIRK
jgi:uncharacterized damage-inducible protein DinB